MGHAGGQNGPSRPQNRRKRHLQAPQVVRGTFGGNFWSHFGPLFAWAKTPQNAAEWAPVRQKPRLAVRLGQSEGWKPPKLGAGRVKWCPRNCDFWLARDTANFRFRITGCKPVGTGRNWANRHHQRLEVRPHTTKGCIWATLLFCFVGNGIARAACQGCLGLVWDPLCHLFGPRGPSWGVSGPAWQFGMPCRHLVWCPVGVSNQTFL